MSYESVKKQLDAAFAPKGTTATAPANSSLNSAPSGSTGYDRVRSILEASLGKPSSGNYTEIVTNYDKWNDYRNALLKAQKTPKGPVMDFANAGNDALSILPGRGNTPVNTPQPWEINAPFKPEEGSGVDLAAKRRTLDEQRKDLMKASFEDYKESYKPFEPTFKLEEPATPVVNDNKGYSATTDANVARFADIDKEIAALDEELAAISAAPIEAGMAKHDERAKTQEELEHEYTIARDAYLDFQSNMDWDNPADVAKRNELKAKADELKEAKKAGAKAIKEGEDWEGRQEMIDEYNRLSSEYDQWMLSGGTANPEYAYSGEAAAKLLEAIHRMDVIAGNGVRDFNFRDRAASIMGSVAKGIVGSGAELIGNVGEAATNAYLTGRAHDDDGDTVYDEYGNPVFTMSAEERAAINEKAATPFDDIYNFADGLSESAAADIARAKEGLGAVARAGVDVVQNVLEMSFDAGVAAVTGGGSLASMFTRVLGSSLGEARREGVDIVSRLGYGVTKATVEVVTEKMFDGVAGIYGKGFVSKDIIDTVVNRLAHTPTGKALLGLVANGTSESIEELVSGLFDPVAEAWKTGKIGKLDFEETMYSMLIGFTVGSLFGTAEISSDVSRSTSLNEAYAQLGENPIFSQEVTDRHNASEDTYIGSHDPNAERERTIRDALLNPKPAPGRSVEKQRAAAIEDGAATSVNALANAATGTTGNRAAPARGPATAAQRFVQNIMDDPEMDATEKAQRILSTSYNETAFEELTGITLDGTEQENLATVSEWLQNGAGEEIALGDTEAPPAYHGKHEAPPRELNNASEEDLEQDAPDVDQTYRSYSESEIAAMRQREAERAAMEYGSKNSTPETRAATPEEIARDRAAQAKWDKERYELDHRKQPYSSDYGYRGKHQAEPQSVSEYTAQEKARASYISEQAESYSNLLTGDKSLDSLIVSAYEQVRQDSRAIDAIMNGENGWDSVPARQRAEILNRVDPENEYYTRGAAGESYRGEVVRAGYSETVSDVASDLRAEKEDAASRQRLEQDKKADAENYDRKRGVPAESKNNRRYELSPEDKAEVARKRAESKRNKILQSKGIDPNKVIRHPALGQANFGVDTPKFMAPLLTDVQELGRFVNGEGKWRMFAAADRLDTLRNLYPNANWQFDSSTNTISLSREAKSGAEESSRFENGFVGADGNLPSSNQNDIFEWVQEAGIKVPQDSTTLKRPGGFSSDQIANERAKRKTGKAERKADEQTGRKGKHRAPSQMLADAAAARSSKDAGRAGRRGPLVSLSNIGKKSLAKSIAEYRNHGARLVEHHNFTDEEIRLERDAAKFGAHLTIMDAANAPDLHGLGAVTTGGRNPSIILFRNTDCELPKRVILRHELAHMRIRMRFNQGHGASMLYDAFEASGANDRIFSKIARNYRELYSDDYTQKLTKGKYSSYLELVADNSDAAQQYRLAVDNLVYEEAYCDLIAGNAERFVGDTELEAAFPDLVVQAYVVAKQSGLFTDPAIRLLVTSADVDSTIRSAEQAPQSAAESTAEWKRRVIAQLAYKNELAELERTIKELELNELWYSEYANQPQKAAETGKELKALYKERDGVKAKLDTLNNNSSEERPTAKPSAKSSEQAPQSSSEYAEQQSAKGEDGRSNADMQRQYDATDEEAYRQQRYADTHGVDNAKAGGRALRDAQKAAAAEEAEAKRLNDSLAAERAYGEAVWDIRNVDANIEEMFYEHDADGKRTMDYGEDNQSEPKPVKNRNARHLGKLSSAVADLARGTTTIKEFADIYHDFAEEDTDTAGYFYSKAVDNRLKRCKGFRMSSEGEYSVADRAYISETMTMLEHTVKRALDMRATNTTGVAELKANGNETKNRGIFSKWWLKQMRPDTVFHSWGGYKGAQKSSVTYGLAEKAADSTKRKINTQTAAHNYFRDAMSNVKAYRAFARGETKIKTKIPGLDRSVSMNEALGLLRTLETEGAMDHIIKSAERTDDNRGTMFSSNEKELFSGKNDYGFRNGTRVPLLSENTIRKLNEAYTADSAQRGRAIAGARAKARLELEALASSLRAEIEADSVASKFDKAITMSMRMLGKEIDSTYMQMYGVKAAKQGKNYWPLSIANNGESNELMANIQSGLKNSRIVQERTGPSGALRIMTATDVMSRYIDAATDFASFAALSDELELMSKSYRGDTSFKAQIDKSFGKDASKWLETYAESLNGKHAGRDGLGATIRGHLAQSSLLLNGGVALKQSPSYFDIVGAGIDFDVAMKAWRPLRSAKSWSSGALVDAISGRSSILASRRSGLSDVETGDMTKRARDLSKRIVDRVPSFLTNWIVKTDFRTVSNVLLACQMQVEKDGGMRVGSNEYYDEIARKFEEAVLKTQPQYTEQFRAEYQRSDNEVIRGLAMFRSQQTQNLNQFVNAAGEYHSAKNSGNEAAAKAAKKRLNQVIAGQVTGSVLFGALSAVARGLLRKDEDFEDKEGNITVSSVAARIGLNTLESMAGTVWFGDVIAKVVTDSVTGALSKVEGSNVKATKEFYNFADNAIGVVDDLLTNTVRFFSGPSLKTAKNFAFSVSQLSGLPVRNVYNMLNSVAITLFDASGKNYGNYLDVIDYCQSRMKMTDKQIASESTAAALRAYGKGRDDAARAILSTLDYSSKDIVSTVKAAAKKAYIGGELTEAQFKSILSGYCNISSDEVKKTLAEAGQTIEYNEAKDKNRAGFEAAEMLIKAANDEVRPESDERNKNYYVMDAIIDSMLPPSDTDIFVKNNLTKEYRENYNVLRTSGMSPKDTAKLLESIDSSKNAYLDKDEMYEYYLTHKDQEKQIEALWNSQGYTAKGTTTWAEYLKTREKNMAYDEFKANNGDEETDELAKAVAALKSDSTMHIQKPENDYSIMKEIFKFGWDDKGTDAAAKKYLSAEGYGYYNICRTNGYSPKKATEIIKAIDSSDDKPNGQFTQKGLYAYYLAHPEDEALIKQLFDSRGTKTDWETYKKKPKK